MTATDPPDAELVRRTLAGDRDAFAGLYDRYARLVRAVAADAGPGRGEDACQEAFLRAYRALGRLRDAERFGPWLVGIARRVTREARRRPRGEPLPDAVADPRPPHERDADDADEFAHALALVARLPEEERRAVRLFFLSGRDAGATARLLGRSRSGTYALIARAVATLARRAGAERTPREAPR